ncbi:MAG: Asp23/Gls24 family envelope stress response protein [Lachnospiraceae bacterium]|nr:Asp23/Gls24 family envelope stress response protein [Lachnospiraceae bacterium]MCR5769513.1 Asp23/Gls24 family envelope stress response protein [Lachnospiraceae bacterium]
MNGTFVTGLGEVLVDDDVIAKCAGAAACECFGIVGMSAISVKDGLARLLKKENLSKGVTASIENNKLRIELHVIVSYGINIPSVCQNLVENVKYRVEDTTGLEVKRIDIYVEGVRVID